MTNEIVVEHVGQIPDILKEGVLYVSYEFNIAIHLCACGCGRETITPITNGNIEHRDHIKNDPWHIWEIDGKISMTPSIGNWSGQSPYHAHYYITNNKIEWL